MKALPTCLLALFLLLAESVSGDISNFNEVDVIDEEPNGPIDFSQAEEQPDGSRCVTKTKMIQKLEKQQVKECWHENITACHETYVTEFRPNQEQVCEENFWKACKITFKEVSYNYTLKTCTTPLVKKCDDNNQQPSYGGYGAPEPKMVCKTWFESVCNTTYVEDKSDPEKEPKPQTWCQKVPKKICAPDNCRMEQGEEECHDKVLESTNQKPEEVCDLQPSTSCRLVTNLVPHLESQTVCKDIPKEVCHLKLDHPKMVQKPVKLKWCTKATKEEEPAKPSYYSPPPTSYLPAESQAPVLTQYQPNRYEPQAQPSYEQPSYQSAPQPQQSYPQPSYQSSSQAPPTPGPYYIKPIGNDRVRRSGRIVARKGFLPRIKL